jgi:integrase
LKPRTREHYARLIGTRLEPEFGALALEEITPTLVRAWYGRQDAKAPTMRAHSYALLRTIMGSAVEASLIRVNPCAIKGAQHAEAVHQARPASVAELEAIVEALPDKYRLLVLLAAWCAFRYGELAELRRSDVDLDRGVIHVRRGVVRMPGKVLVGTPKSRAGIRDVAIPPHLMPMLERHLNRYAQLGRDGLLFPSRTGENLSPHTFYRHFERATAEAGRPDLRVHDLRHTGAVLAAQTGATLADLMSRLGHSTPQAAMRYQHAAAERDRLIASRLSELASGAARIRSST